MHQARTMQARKSILYVQTAPEFEHKLAYRPRPLLRRLDQEAVDARVRYAQDIASVHRRVVLHGSSRSFATAPGQFTLSLGPT